MGLAMQGSELERHIQIHNISGKENPFHSFVVLKIWWGSLGELYDARPKLVELRWLEALLETGRRK